MPRFFCLLTTALLVGKGLTSDLSKANVRCFQG